MSLGVYFQVIEVMIVAVSAGVVVGFTGGANWEPCVFVTVNAGVSSSEISIVRYSCGSDCKSKCGYCERGLLTG